MMRKTIKGGGVALMALLMCWTAAVAGNGYRWADKGAQVRTGISVVCSGTPVEVTGIVSDVNDAGSGMEVATADGAVMVYGIGPYRYWDSLDVDRPAVGDTVTLSGMRWT